jgi:hypothetical protein
VDQFDGEFYLRALTAVAAADEMVESEVEYIRSQAEMLGLDAEQALASGVTLADLPATSTVITRRLAYRDCFVLASMDGPPNDKERRVLNELRVASKSSLTLPNELKTGCFGTRSLLAKGEALLVRE